MNLLLGWLLLWRVAHLLRLRLTRLLHHLQERENVGKYCRGETRSRWWKPLMTSICFSTSTVSHLGTASAWTRQRCQHWINIDIKRWFFFQQKMLFLEFGILTTQDQHIMLIGLDTSRHFSYQISFAFQHWDSIVWKKAKSRLLYFFVRDVFMVDKP